LSDDPTGLPRTLPDVDGQHRQVCRSRLHVSRSQTWLRDEEARIHCATVGPDSGCLPACACSKSFPSSICAATSVLQVFRCGSHGRSADPSRYTLTRKDPLGSCSMRPDGVMAMARRNNQGQHSVHESVHEQTILTHKVAGGAPGGRTLNQRIKSLSGRGSLGFAGLRVAGQTACAYPRELGQTAANCNLDCNPAGAKMRYCPNCRLPPSGLRITVQDRP
jgi:hypothetical protein